MTLRKTAALILAAVLLFLCGCRDKKASESGEPRQMLVIGSDIYAPYFYIGENGDFAGVDVEIARAACKKLNVEPVFKKINWQNKDETLNNGDVDCLWGSFSMTGREDAYSWAGPYLKSRQVAVVKTSSDIFKLNDLNGKSIAVQNGSKPEELFLENSLPQIKSLRNVYCFSSIGIVFAALKKGYVDACAGHETAFMELMKSSAGEYRILEEPLLEVELGVAFSKESPAFSAERLTNALNELQSDGVIADIIASYGLSSDALIGG